jgi:hypothetical protein
VHVTRYKDKTRYTQDKRRRIKYKKEWLPFLGYHPMSVGKCLERVKENVFIKIM